jgi:N utilization substance protein A
MAKDISEALSMIVAEKGISAEMAVDIVERTILAAYKKAFGRDDNAVIEFSEDGREVSLFAKKEVVDGVYDPVTEIELEEALEEDPNAEVGDELQIELDPSSDFGRIAVTVARSEVTTKVKEIRKDSLYAEFKEKEGEIIVGYAQRERNGTIYVNIGNQSVEGVFPKKFQSARETYAINDRIRALIYKVEKSNNGLQVVLSRTHTDFVKAIFEAEVPEVYDKTVEIHKIVREPGYRTKLAVFSNKDEVDPVGALVGMKGARIQNVIRELEGEKIDVFKWEPDPAKLIKNALSPADVDNVIILDETMHKALAIVNESQLSLAIGKQGLNVRLANRLCDWNIDVKTHSQAAELDIAGESRRAALGLFNDSAEEEILRIIELPDVDQATADILAANGIHLIQDFLDAGEQKLNSIAGLGQERAEALRALIAEYEYVEEEVAESDAVGEGEVEVANEPAPASAVEDEEEYECPECGAVITLNMTVCPKCGAELSFEFEE